MTVQTSPASSPTALSRRIFFESPKSFWWRRFKSTFRSLTLLYFNFLSIFFLTSFFLNFFFTSFFLSFFSICLLTPDEDCVWKALVFLIVLYVSSYRWVPFSRAVLCCQPHQQLFTHSSVQSNNLPKHQGGVRGFSGQGISLLIWEQSFGYNEGNKRSSLWRLLLKAIHSWVWAGWL